MSQKAAKDFCLSWDLNLRRCAARALYSRALFTAPLVQASFLAILRDSNNLRNTHPILLIFCRFRRRENTHPFQKTASKMLLCSMSYDCERTDGRTNERTITAKSHPYITRRGRRRGAKTWRKRRQKTFVSPGI